MKTAFLALVLLASSAQADVQIRPMFVLAHTSDFTRSEWEVTQDFIGVGAEVQFRSIRIEGALGRKATDCQFSRRCGSTPGGYAAFKWMPRFGR